MLKKKSSKSKEVDAEISITTSKVKKTSSSSTKKKRTRPRSVEAASKKVKKRKKALEGADEFVAKLETRLEETGEQEYLREYLFLYKKLKKMVRKAEARAMETGQSRDYYAVVTLISQQREVIADLRTMSDLSGQVQIVVEQALQPMVSQLGQALVNSFYQQRRLILETSKERETQFALKKLDEITTDVSKILQVYYEQAALKINEILVGVPEDKPKKKRK